MTNEKMTVHRALAELKTMDARIAKEIDNSSFVFATKEKSTLVNGVVPEVYKANGISSYDKINDLIKRRNAIKRAVVKSNASTLVTINGVEYAVAEAIEMKQSGILNKERLLMKLEREYANALKKVEQTNSVLETEADNYVKNASTEKSTKLEDVDSINAIRETYLKARIYAMFECLETKKEIELLSDEINKFKADVDAELSVSNAITVLDFSY